MPANSDDLLIRGNKNLLMLAFKNLLENAIKFSDNKSVSINLVYLPGSITVTISDSGIGIPEKDLSYIFQTFYRAENARTFSGSGVGLALSQTVFKLHNGELQSGQK